MRSFLVILATLFVTSICYGEIEYAYEKVSDSVVKILEIETTQRISETNITIENLRIRIANLEEAKTDVLNRYNENIGELDGDIALIETQIEKAKELGVLEEPEIIE